jgi:glycosyltransferase involved in cell wall biosynthesis
MIHSRASEFDGYLVHSRYYRDFMSAYLRLPIEKFHVIPLGIDLEGHDGRPELRNHGKFTVGYFARVCPEKGLHELVEAFRLLHARHPGAQLLAGGYLGPQHSSYLQSIEQSAKELGSAFRYVGSPATRSEKVSFLKSLDVLSVPTVYREPKGLYVLEAAANGVPVVQPSHGAFPELIESTGGGLLVKPGDPVDLSQGLEELMLNRDRRLALATDGHANVRSRHDARAMARKTLALFHDLARNG